VIDEGTLHHFEQTDPPGQPRQLTNELVTGLYPLSDVALPVAKPRDRSVRVAKRFVGFRGKEVHVIPHLPLLSLWYYPKNSTHDFHKRRTMFPACTSSIGRLSARLVSSSSNKVEAPIIFDCSNLLRKFFTSDVVCSAKIYNGHVEKSMLPTYRPRSLQRCRIIGAVRSLTES
jgi:hypothetical protein